MKVNTVVRFKVRKDGSIGIPKRIRDSLGIMGGDIIDFNVSNNVISLKLSQRRCPICGKPMGTGKPMGPVDICDVCSSEVLTQIRKGKDFDGAVTFVAAKHKRVTTK